jgi:ribose 5-phosphate isomerase B
MKIAVASDHAGFEDPKPHYKPAIVAHIEARGHEVVDCGPFDADAVDYPDYAGKVAEKVLSGQADRGVLLCGAGIGMSIAANRFKGIRAAACTTPEMAELSRTHNDANVICVGRRILPLDECLNLIDIWLDTPFSGAERHKRRVEKMG